MTQEYPKIKHDSGWAIPQDWDGETFKCIALQWPNSVQYSRQLIGMLFTLTRGRSYDRNTGTITDATAQGWSIFDANYPLVECGGDTNNNTNEDTPCPTCGGGLIVVEGDDVGQVVTNVYINAAGQLAVEFGPCCVKTFDISTGTAPVVLGTDGEVIDVPGIVAPEIDQDYTACGKATVMASRIFAIGQAAWDARANPLAVAGAIKDANPGYSFSMVAVSNIYLAMVLISTFEAVGDGDLFSQSFEKDLKCWLAKRLDDTSKGLSQTEFVEFTGWLVSYRFLHGAHNEIVDTALDAAIGAFWQWVAVLVGVNRLEQIGQEALGVAGDCSDCDSYGDGDDTYDWSQVYDFTVDNQGWSVAGAGEGSYVSEQGFTGTSGWMTDGSLLSMYITTLAGTFEGAIKRIKVTFSGMLEGSYWVHDSYGQFGAVRVFEEEAMNYLRAGGVMDWSGTQVYDQTSNVNFEFQFGCRETDGDPIIVTKVEFFGDGVNPFEV